MRRAAVILLALVMGAPGLPGAAKPTVDASALQMAWSDWVVMDSPTHGKLYFAGGLRLATPDGVYNLGVIGSGDCDVDRNKNYVVVMCRGSGEAKEVGIDEFFFDPALRSASLTMKAGGTRNSVRWRGRGRAPQVGASVAGSGSMVAVDAGSGRTASVKARILGRRMVTRGWMDFAFLAQGASAYAFQERGARRSIEFAPDGTYSYDVTLRIPR